MPHTVHTSPIYLILAATLSIPFYIYGVHAQGHSARTLEKENSNPGLHDSKVLEVTIMTPFNHYNDVCVGEEG